MRDLGNSFKILEDQHWEPKKFDFGLICGVFGGEREEVEFLSLQKLWLNENAGRLLSVII